MNRKNLTVILVLAAVLLIVGAVFYHFYIAPPRAGNSAETPQNPYAWQAPSAASSSQNTSRLTNEIVLDFLKDKLFAECRSEGIPGSYASCTMNTVSTDGGPVSTVTYNGLYDDSVTSKRYQVTLLYQGGKWVLEGSVYQEQKCAPGRGHQDFSQEPCV
jgi:hypothetical protein